MDLEPLSSDYVIFDKAQFQRFLGAFVDEIPPNSRGHKLRLMLCADDIAVKYSEAYTMETLIKMREDLKRG